MRRIASERSTGILLVEQHVRQALQIADRVYVMQRGRIVISGESPVLAQNEHVFAIVRGTEEVSAPARSG